YDAVLPVALGLFLVALWVGFARGPAEAGRLLRYTAACVCAVLVFGKVLSPQYLVWLVPLVPLVRGRRGLLPPAAPPLPPPASPPVAWGARLVCSPNCYSEFVLTGPLAWLVLARNLVLLAILAVLAWPRREPLGPLLPAPAEVARSREIPVATLD